MAFFGHGLGLMPSTTGSRTRRDSAGLAAALGPLNFMEKRFLRLDREPVYRRILFVIAMCLVPTPATPITGVVPAIFHVPLLITPFIFLEVPHLLIFGGVLYLLSVVLSNFIIRLPSRRYRLLAIGMILASIGLLSASEVYRPLSHSNTNLLGLLSGEVLSGPN